MCVCYVCLFDACVRVSAQAFSLSPGVLFVFIYSPICAWVYLCCMCAYPVSVSSVYVSVHVS